MDLKVEYKGQSKSKLTISSQGEVRLKISDKDKDFEKDIIDYAKSEKERLGDVTLTIRKNIYINDGKIENFPRRRK